MGLKRIGRLLRGAAIVGLAAALLGCSTPQPLTKLAPLGTDARDDALRKRVEADPFPSAKKVGL